MTGGPPCSKLAFMPALHSSCLPVEAVYIFSTLRVDTLTQPKHSMLQAQAPETFWPSCGNETRSHSLAIFGHPLMDSDWPEEDSRVDRLVRWLKLVVLGHPERRRALSRWLNAVLRGAAVGFCLRGGLHVVSLALALASKARRSKQRQTRQQSLWDKLTETGRYTAFLGALAGVFVGVDEGVAAVWGKSRWDAPVLGLITYMRALANEREFCVKDNLCFLFAHSRVLLVCMRA